MEIFTIAVILAIITSVLMMLIGLGMLIFFGNEEAYEFLMKAGIILILLVLLVVFSMGVIIMFVELLKLII